jgi:hypothetical protein
VWVRPTPLSRLLWPAALHDTAFVRAADESRRGHSLGRGPRVAMNAFCSPMRVVCVRWLGPIGVNRLYAPLRQREEYAGVHTHKRHISHHSVHTLDTFVGAGDRVCGAGAGAWRAAGGARPWVCLTVTRTTARAGGAWCCPGCGLAAVALCGEVGAQHARTHAGLGTGVRRISPLFRRFWCV